MILSSSDISSPEVTGPWGPVATLEICALEGEEGSAKSARGDEGRRRRAFFSSALEKKKPLRFYPPRHGNERSAAFERRICTVSRLDTPRDRLHRASWNTRGSAEKARPRDPRAARIGADAGTRGSPPRAAPRGIGAARAARGAAARKLQKPPPSNRLGD
jgi:hypothetical protein